MVYAVEGPTIVENGYTYPATQEDGVWIADAYLHDLTVLPHQVPGDLNLLFPKAVAAEEYPEIQETADAMERIGMREVEKSMIGRDVDGRVVGDSEEFCDSIGSIVISSECSSSSRGASVVTHARAHSTYG